MAQGSSVLTGTFLGVDAGETFDIQDLKLVGDTVTPTVDNIQLLNSDSVSFVTYAWTDADNSPVWEEDPTTGEWYGVPGWLTEDGSGLLDWDVPASQGFVIYAENEGVSVQVAGQVKQTTKSFVTEGGSCVVGNFNPTAIDIQSIKLAGDAVTATVDNIQLLNTDSVSYVTYAWTDADNSPVWEEDPTTGEWYGVPGWLTEDGSGLLNWDIPAGQAFVLYTENAGVTVTIPSYNNVAQ